MLREWVETTYQSGVGLGVMGWWHIHVDGSSHATTFTPPQGVWGGEFGAIPLGAIIRCLDCGALVSGSEYQNKIEDIKFMRRLVTNFVGWLLKTSQGIIRVELFGALSRGGGSLDSDFDLVVCVSRFTAWRWRRKVRKLLHTDLDLYRWQTASARRKAAFELLHIDLEALQKQSDVDPFAIDIFLFVKDWRRRLSKLQKQGHHKDPNFMQNIANDAIRFFPEAGFIFPMPNPYA
ncbi:nucleotidyltransferase domain-containing protein [Candidatus Microgenomates bacterium]|nr:nucleotidyltransferase domain-containing protein [Candidatus Microgenomates bacterium]